MKIKFLGTSAGWPLPRLGCLDKICNSKDSRDTRTRSQVLVNNKLLLDIGPDTYFHLSQKGIDPTKISHAAITHEHPDHTFGLWDLGHIYNGQKIKILVHEATYKKIKQLFFYKEYDVIQIKGQTALEKSVLKVSFLPVNHTKDSSFGILIEQNGKQFFWAPDFKSLPESTKEILKNVDLLAMDGSELKVRTPSHQTIEEGIKLAKNLKAKEVYFVHIGHRTFPHDELETFVQKEGKQFHIAFDALELKLN